MKFGTMPNLRCMYLFSIHHCGAMTQLEENTAPEGTRAVIRAFQTLECLCMAGKGVRIMELSQKLQLNKATIFRILSTLSSLGYVEKAHDSECYRPTMKILSVSNNLLGSIELRTLAAPHIQALAREAGQAVHLSVRDADSTVIVEKVEAQSSFRVAFHVGRRSNLYSTGTGKVFLAMQDKAELEAYLTRVPLESLTAHTICNRLRLLEELEAIRANGYALDRQENSLGVSCVAAPIWDFSGKNVAAISVTGGTTEIETATEHLIPFVKSAALGISRTLGFQGLIPA